MLRKKPDKYRVKKGILKNVTNILYQDVENTIPFDEQPLDIIKNVVLRMNKMRIYAHQFLEAYYLHCFKENSDLPVIDINFLRLCHRAVSYFEEKRGTRFTYSRTKGSYGSPRYIL